MWNVTIKVARSVSAGDRSEEEVTEAVVAEVVVVAAAAVVVATIGAIGMTPRAT